MIFVNIGIFIAVMIGILLLYKGSIWEGVESDSTINANTATATQNTISTGVTAVSILLPLTVGLLGFIIKEPKKGTVPLLCACLFFTLSLITAIWNLNRIPSIVNVFNLANDIHTLALMMIQLFSLLWGVFYLTFGAFRIISNIK